MKSLSLIAVGAFAAIASPAAASIMVAGNSPGFSCYAVAKAKNGSSDALERCNQAFETGLLSRRDIVATHVNRGIVRMYGGDNETALADFDRAISLDPDQPESYLNKGSALIRLGANPASAIALFDEALRRNTRRPELAYFSRGIAHEVAGNLQQAYLDYRRARELAPRWEQPAKEMSRFQVRPASVTRM